LPLGGEAWVELAVRVPAGQVVEDIEGDPDVVRGGAEVRVELRDITGLRRDQLFLLGGLGESRARERGRNGSGGPESGGALEKIAARELYAWVPPWFRIGLAGSVR